MQLTKNFKLEEFSCKDGTVVPQELIPNVQELASYLQIIRNELGFGFTPNSAYRTIDHNKDIGGSKKSRHLTAEACDIPAKKISSIKLYNLIDRLIKDGKIKEGGLGLYNSFVHYDIRGYRARWDNR